MAAPITFVVPGVRADRGATRGAGGAASPIGRVKDSITVTAQRAAGESEVRTTAIPGEDVVLIEVAGGPELWLHPDTARELLQSQQDPLLRARRRRRAAARRGARFRPVAVAPRGRRARAGRDARLPRGRAGPGVSRRSPALPRTRRRISWPRRSFRRSTSRSIPACTGSIAVCPSRSKEAAVRHRCGRSAIPGADPRHLQRNHRHVRQALEGASAARRRLFDRFRNRVYALDHPTLGASPIANAHHAGAKRCPTARGCIC